MKLLWKCAWENGYVSFVLGRSKREAMSVLAAELQEEIDPDMLEPVDHGASFFVTFCPCFDEKCEQNGPHWHSNDALYSLGLEHALGEPVPPPPPEAKALPPADDGPVCQKCGHPRFASVHHPDYDRPNKCQFAPPPPAPLDDEKPVGPESPIVEAAKRAGHSSE